MQRAPRTASQLLPPLRRLLHSGSARDPSFSVPLPSPRRPGLSGMDMSGAPGYAVSAETPPPASMSSRLREFAQRHAGLAPADFAHAPGYLWVAPVIYPAGAPAASFTVSWDADADGCILADAVVGAAGAGADTREETPHHHHHPASSRRMYHAKRRYSGGQARRIRQQRQESIQRRARRRAPTKPKRKPKNDLPPAEEQA